MDFVDTIPLAAGDYNPEVQIELRDPGTGEPGEWDTWDPVDLSPAGRTVRLYIVAQGGSAALADILCTKVGDGSAGQCFAPRGSYQFVTAGVFEGEIKLLEDGQAVTVNDRVRFRVRPGVAA